MQAGRLTHFSPSIRLSGKANPGTLGRKKDLAMAAEGHGGGGTDLRKKNKPLEKEGKLDGRYDRA